MQTHSFALPISITRDGTEPYKRQIMRQIEWLIVSGCLQPGDRLPSIAALMAMLRVSRNTVVGAYECLTDAGLLRGEPGRGFFVATDTPRMSSLPSPGVETSGIATSAHQFAGSGADIATPGVHTAPPPSPVRFDFKIGRPAPDAFPARRWAKLANPLLRHMGHAMTEYTPAEGLWGLRVQIADYLAATRALAVDPGQIIVVADVQEALHLLATHFIRHGSRVVMESPGYAGFCNLPRLGNAVQVTIPVDAQGLCTHALPEAPVQLAYTTPSHQYPLGYTMSLDRRRELLAWAARVGAFVIEDDYDGDFAYDSALLPPLAALDPTRVVYVGTFSKVLGPGLRLGFMVCPPRLADAIARRKALLNHGCPWLEQAVLARLFEYGDYSRHLYKLRRRYRAQRDALLAGLRSIWGDDCQISGASTGMHLALHLPTDSPPADEIVQCALANGIRFYPLPEAACGNASEKTDRVVLFGYASLTTRQIGEAMSLLKSVLTARFRRAVAEPATARPITSVASPC